jgi:outer membrane protein assembly factor BamB
MNSCPIVAQGTVYFRAGDKLYSFDCKNGKRKWAVKAGSLNYCDEGSILVTDDGVLYFADTDEGYLYSVDTR